MHLKADVLDALVVLLAVVDVDALEHHLVGLDVVAGVVLIQLAADHHGDQIVLGRDGNLAGADVGAVAQDGHAVADLVQLAHLVGDVDDADALPGQVAHDVEQMGDLAVGNGGGGLIHDQDAAVEGDRLDDLDHLLLGDAQIGNLRFCIDAQIELIQHLLRIGGHLSKVHAEFAHRLAAEEDVFRNRHVGNQNKLLMDDRNAVVAGGVDARNGDFLAVNPDLTLLRVVDAAQNLDQRRFSCAVFTQQRVDFARFELEVHLLQCLDARK